MRQEERIEALYVKDLQAKVALSDQILANFSDFRAGGPIAYLLAQAAKEAAQATMALTEVSPTEERSIAALQAIVSRQKDIVRWISTALVEGKQAYDLLDQRGRGEIFAEISDSFDDGE